MDKLSMALVAAGLILVALSLSPMILPGAIANQVKVIGVYVTPYAFDPLHYSKWENATLDYLSGRIIKVKGPYIGKAIVIIQAPPYSIRGFQVIFEGKIYPSPDRMYGYGVLDSKKGIYLLYTPSLYEPIPFKGYDKLTFKVLCDDGSYKCITLKLQGTSAEELGYSNLWELMEIVAVRLDGKLVIERNKELDTTLVVKPNFRVYMLIHKYTGYADVPYWTEIVGAKCRVLDLQTGKEVLSFDIPVTYKSAPRKAESGRVMVMYILSGKCPGLQPGKYKLRIEVLEKDKDKITVPAVIELPIGIGQEPYEEVPLAQPAQPIMPLTAIGCALTAAGIARGIEGAVEELWRRIRFR